VYSSAYVKNNSTRVIFKIVQNFNFDFLPDLQGLMSIPEFDNIALRGC
jgi:hypothetical protein